MNLFSFQSVASDMAGEHPVIEVQLKMRRNPAAIAPVVEQLMWVIKACQCVHREDRGVETALHEALKIAVAASGAKANEVLDDIRVKCRCESEKEVWVMIGFARTMTARAEDLGMDSAVHRIKRCVDEVRFEKDGSSLHLRQRRDSQRAVSLRPSTGSSARG